jgi:hypothetical protein
MVFENKEEEGAEIILERRRGKRGEEMFAEEVTEQRKERE